VKGNNVDDSCCIVFANNPRPNSSKGEIRLPKTMAKLQTCHSSFGENPEMWNIFDTMLGKVADRTREKDENKLMQ
jgi:hypothetical protein